MSLTAMDGIPRAAGRSVLGVVSPAGIWTPHGANHNDLLYAWGFIAAQAIGKGRRDYRISAMYVEFENLADPEDPVAIPTVSREEGVDYYNDLSSSGVKDYLRVPLIGEPAIGIASGFENYFTDGTDGNQLTFFAQATGVTGVHGKTFSVGVNSKIYGAALVATPVWADSTQDVVFSRSYYETDDQLVKPTPGQAGIQWVVTFE